MKILMVAESYWPNTDGGSVFARRLMHGLAERGHEAIIWAPGTRLRSYVETDGPTTIYREKSIVQIFNPKYRVSFFPFFNGYSLLKRLRPDIVHLNLMGWMSVPTLIYCKRHRVPLLAVNHLMPENILLNVWIHGGVLYEPLRRFLWRFLVWFYGHADYVTSPTSTAIKLLEDHGLKTAHQAISNGLDTDHFQPGPVDPGFYAKYGLPTDRPIILHLGRIDGEKRVDLIIKAFAELTKTTEAHLLIAGYGNHLAIMKDLAKRLGLDQQVTFTGFIDEADKPLFYRAAQQFVIASPAELQSIVMMEAMATGVPVIAVDVAALGELCLDGQTGYLFPRDDTTALARNMKRLIDNPAKAKQMGASGRQLIVTRHSSLATLNQFETLYLDLIKSKKRGVTK